MDLRAFLSEFRIYSCNFIFNKIPFHFIRLYFYRSVMKFHIGPGSSIGLNSRCDATTGLIVGRDSVINGNCRLDTRGEIFIGDNVSISEEVIILTVDHDMNKPDFSGRKRSVEIADYVFVGTRAMILPGVQIGRGAIIAAGALVTKDVPEFSVYAGVPAKFIKKRPENLNYSASYLRFFK